MIMCSDFYTENIWKNRDNFTLDAKINSKLIFGEPELIQNPLFTIFIPTYKRPNLVKDAVLSAISQKCNFEYEIIVIDNDPIDIGISETEIVLSKIRNRQLLYYRNEQNIGLGNWNRGVELARGKWVVMLHDDDLLNKNHLHEVSKILIKKPEINLLSVGSVLFDKIDKRKNIFNYFNLFLNLITYYKPLVKLTYWHYYLQNPSPNTGCVFNRNSILKLGGFDSRYNPIPDYALSLKMMIEFNNCYHLNRNLAYYRILLNDIKNIHTLLGVFIANHFVRVKILTISPYIKYIDFGFDKSGLFVLNKFYKEYTINYQTPYFDNIISKLHKIPLLNLYRKIFLYTSIIFTRIFDLFRF